MWKHSSTIKHLLNVITSHLPAFRFTGSDQWLVLYWVECPTSSSLLAVHLARSWSHVWPVRTLKSWRRPAWPAHLYPQSHRTPWEPSTPTNKKTTEDKCRKKNHIETPTSCSNTAIFMEMHGVPFINRVDQAWQRWGPKKREKLCINKLALIQNDTVPASDSSEGNIFSS